MSVPNTCPPPPGGDVPAGCPAPRGAVPMRLPGLQGTIGGVTPQEATRAREPSRYRVDELDDVLARGAR